MAAFKHLDTQLIHAGEPRPRIGGAVTTPIFQSAMFEYSGETSYHDLKYIRLNNTPNHQVLDVKLAALEGGEAGLVAASGMAAISTTLLAVLSAGDHILAQDCLYGGTYDFLTRDFADFGIAYDFVDAEDPASWKAKLRPNTKAIYAEAMTNPLLQVGDLEGIAAFAKAHGLISIIDNTFATPVNFRPLEHGFDLSLHSATKYLNGHSDIVAGAVVGSAALVQRVRHKLNHLGGSLDPHACFLLTRGLKTLAVRVRHQNVSTLEIARRLERHPVVAHVNYPGLASHPRHARAASLFAGHGGVLSFELHGGTAAAQKFIHHTTLPVVAPSLGGVETLITRPATTSHAGMSPEERRRAGVTDGLVRVAVGLESADEIAADFEQALDAVGVAVGVG